MLTLGNHLSPSHALTHHKLKDIKRTHTCTHSSQIRIHTRTCTQTHMHTDTHSSQTYKHQTHNQPHTRAHRHLLIANANTRTPTHSRTPMYSCFPFRHDSTQSRHAHAHRRSAGPGAADSAVLLRHESLSLHVSEPPQRTRARRPSSTPIHKLIHKLVNQTTLQNGAKYPNLLELECLPRSGVGMKPQKNQGHSLSIMIPHTQRGNPTRRT